MVRKAKSENKLSMRTELPAATLTGPTGAIEAINLATGDLAAAGRIQDLSLVVGGDAVTAEVTLPAPDEGMESGPRRSSRAVHAFGGQDGSARWSVARSAPRRRG